MSARTLDRVINSAGWEVKRAHRRKGVRTGKGGIWATPSGRERGGKRGQEGAEKGGATDFAASRDGESFHPVALVARNLLALRVAMGGPVLLHLQAVPDADAAPRSEPCLDSVT
jgi:hypothetical protein